MRESLKLNRRNRRQRHPGNNKRKFKSGLEKLFAAKLLQAGLGAEYEPDRFPFVKKSHYTPDFKIAPNRYIETKGYFAPSDRAKLISFKEQYPHITIYLCFGNARNKLNRNSKTTYATWAESHGFPWCDIAKGIPKEWWD